jgi:hypothetical protein
MRMDICNYDFLQTQILATKIVISIKFESKLYSILVIWLLSTDD